MTHMLLALSIFFFACDARPVWHLDRPIYVSTAWNLPNASDAVGGVEEVITALGGIVAKGAGPETNFAPIGAQKLHIWDTPPGVGQCDLGGNILGFADEEGIHVCHTPAVLSAAFNPPSVAALGAKITAMHETLHLGGQSWHWSCASLGNEMRIMGAVRTCELVEHPTSADLDYACAGGHYIGGLCSNHL